MGLPGAVFADEGVGEDDEFSHDGGYRDLCELSALMSRSWKILRRGL